MIPITQNQTNQSLDWHPADVKAALEKVGWSLRRLARHYNYSPTKLSSVLQAPYPKLEALIAFVLGKKPWEIWPSRYNHENKPNRGKNLKRMYHFEPSNSMEKVGA
jgi:Ner family transcriptional regulator